eukprot:13656472-Ditylum_brightwellii.AAC.1
MEETVKEADQLFDYLATYPNATARYTASNMVLYIHSDAVYMVLPEARSHAGGYFYLSNKTKTNDASNVPINRVVHNKCSTIRNAMGSAAEAEVGGLYINCQRGEEMRTALQEMGHPQPPTIVVTDNSMADVI